MRRKLSNKLLVIVSQGAVGTCLRRKILWSEFSGKHLRPFELEECLFHLSLRCSFDVGFLHKTFVELTRNCCLQAREIKFAAFQNLSCHHPRPDITFCHIWLQAGERKLSKSNFNFPVASSRSANCARNFICTWASGCLRVLSALARFFAHIKWVEKMKNLILGGNVNTVYSHWWNELRHWVPFVLKAAGGKMVFREDPKNLLSKHKKSKHKRKPHRAFRK